MPVKNYGEPNYGEPNYGAQNSQNGIATQKLKFKKYPFFQQNSFTEKLSTEP